MKTWFLHLSAVIQAIPARVLASIGLAGVLIASPWIDPSSIPGVCIFRFLTGIPCMFCGLTHSFHALSLGQFQESLEFHPLGVLALALVVFHLVTSILRILGWQVPRLLPRLSVRAMMIMTFALYTAVWGYRLTNG